VVFIDRNHVAVFRDDAGTNVIERVATFFASQFKATSASGNHGKGFSQSRQGQSMAGKESPQSGGVQSGGDAKDGPPELEKELGPPVIGASRIFFHTHSTLSKA
jgi:hypothetical protein